MENIFYEGQVIWSMIDANGHLRHSAYADFGAQARINTLAKFGLDTQLFKAKIGPILFKEELTYLKEIRFNQFIKVSAEVVSYNEDISRYSLRNNVYREDGTICAIIHVDGAWMDLVNRKLCGLPEDIQVYFRQIPRIEDF